MKLSKTLIAAGIAGSSILMTLPTYADFSMPRYMVDKLVDVCKSVKSNKPYRLRKSLRNSNLDVPTINAKLVCNNESVYDFALTHNADKTASYLNKGRVNIQDIAAVGSKYYIYVK